MADGPAALCVCVLFYGADAYCQQLARRILNRPLRELAQGDVEFRFGLNAVSADTRRLIDIEIDCGHFPDITLVDSPTNIYKYPMMRRMFAEKPMQAETTMWFDDNSYIDPDVDTETWYSRVRKQLEHCAMVGSVYTRGLVGDQAAWIKDQAWFNGKPPGPYVKYAAGGWWAIRTEVLNRFGWPTADIVHYGGDVMLGELLRQHDLRLCHFRDNVMIQANDNGVESANVRRGFDAPPVGYEYCKHET